MKAEVMAEVVVLVSVLVEEKGLLKMSLELYSSEMGAGADAKDKNTDLPDLFQI